jgi:hypothetical protein
MFVSMRFGHPANAPPGTANGAVRAFRPRVERRLVLISPISLQGSDL